MPNEYEQPVEPMSRTEDLLRTGTEEPVIAMSEIEKILRGEHIDRPHSRVADLLLQYNPSDILIEKRIEENGTYYATADAADGYYKVVVDTPVIPPTVLEHLVETISTNGSHTFTPGTGVDGFSDASITVNVQPNTMEKSISANGTYIAANDNVDGYSKAIVNVPPEPITEARTVENLPQPIASFNNGAEAPITSLKVAIEPVQDLHGYDSPWAGGSGRNLFNMGSKVDGTIAHVTYTSDDEYLYLNGTKQGGGYADLTALQLTLPVGTYYLKAINISGTASDSVELYPYDGSGHLTSSIINTERTLTLEEEKTFRFRFAIWTDGTVFNNYKVGIVISKTPNIDKFYPYSNICPIEGWDEMDVNVSGVNVWNEVMELGMISDTTGENIENNTRLRTKNYIPIKGDLPFGGVFPFSGDDVKYYFFDVDKNFISHSDWQYKGAYTPPNNAFFMRFWISASYGTTYNNDISINYPSTDTSYHAYTGTTYTIDLDETRYGGEVDVVNGGGTDELAEIDLGALEWALENGIFRLNENIGAKLTTDMSAVANMMCSHYKTVSQSAMGSTSTDQCIAGLNWSNGVRVKDSRYTDVASFKTAMNGVQLVYELATPTIYSTQPTPINSLKGDNNLMANTGDINDVDYIYVNDDVGTLINKSITANGSYCAVTDDNADGYLSIDVNLPDGTNTEY